MIVVDAMILRRIAPSLHGRKAHDQSRLIDAICGDLPTILERYAIHTKLRAAHFLAQACHESDGFCTTEEYASGARYEGRKDLGNVEPGDGVRFKGRGIFQLTGRANYARMGEKLGLNLLDEPRLAAEPAISLRIACEYWNDRRISPLADANDLEGVTRRINGGLNGLADRRACLGRAMAALVEPVPASSPGHPVLRRGDRGDAVLDLQRRLTERGYPLALDGDFGAITEFAIRHLQQAASLAMDGVVGPRTWAVIGGPVPASRLRAAPGGDNTMR